MRMALLGLGFVVSAAAMIAGDVVIHLDGTEPVSRQVIQYQCDGQAIKMGLPGGTISGGIYQRWRQ